MDYKERYNAALEMAREAFYSPETPHVAKAWLLTLFPTITESDDERIRKVLVDFFQAYKDKEEYGITTFNGIQTDHILTWLEKQGEQKPADEVEPKFHKGEWIISDTVSKDYRICKITGIKDGNYTIESTCGYKGYNQFDVFDTAYRLWTIQDAKDGDVLFHSDSASNGIFVFKEILQCGTIQKVLCYCDYDSEDGFCLGENHTCCWTNNKILHPATKEQRDTLIKAMANAGYTFDFEKKELNEVEPKKLDPDKVIEWIDEHVPTKFEDMENYVQQFKKDFDL